MLDDTNYIAKHLPAQGFPACAREDPTIPTPERRSLDKITGWVDNSDHKADDLEQPLVSALPLWL